MQYLEKLRQYGSKYIKPIYVLIFLVFFIPRTLSLGSDISNYDASYWYPRMDRFTSNLLKGDYKGTYQQYHPGVVLMLTSGTSKYAFEKIYEFVYHFNPRFIPHQFIKLQIATILPLVILISLLGTLAFFYIKNIINARFAMIFSILLSLEPFFLGISKFLHLTALTSMFMFLSFLSLYYYYFKGSKNKSMFYFSSILLGLGVLTKIDAAIAEPVNIALVFFSQYRNVSVKKIIGDITLYILISSLVFYILFPAMWVAPRWILKKIVVEGIMDTAFDSGGGESAIKIKALYYLETFFYRSLPTTFVAFTAGIIFFIVNRKKYNSTKRNIFYWVFGYLLFNIVILTIPEKTKDRYLINLYQPMLFISSLAFYELSKLSFKLVKHVTVVLTVFIYAFALYRYYPAYSFYYTELIGGPSGITKLGMNIKNRGEYYAQAAQYINRKSKAEETNAVITHREQIRTFSPFYYGKLYASPGLLPDGASVDYIISRPDMNYLVPLELCDLEKTFGPKEPWGYQEVFVYKCEGMDNTYKNFRN